MIKLGVYNKEGKEVDSLQVDEALFGGQCAVCTAQAGDRDVSCE